jgi:hypothetical protein
VGPGALAGAALSLPEIHPAAAALGRRDATLSSPENNEVGD